MLCVMLFDVHLGVSFASKILGTIGSDRCQIRLELCPAHTFETCSAHMMGVSGLARRQQAGLLKELILYCELCPP